MLPFVIAVPYAPGGAGSSESGHHKNGSPPAYVAAIAKGSTKLCPALFLHRSLNLSKRLYGPELKRMEGCGDASICPLELVWIGNTMFLFSEFTGFRVRDFPVNLSVVSVIQALNSERAEISEKGDGI